jgi:hypothetical protein
MPVRIPWDKYEAALLLEYCIKIENKELTRTEAISTVSQILRSRAIRNGLEIDDVFRNENGIGMQLSSMRNCYLGKKQGLTISKLFYDTVALQKNDPVSFHQILAEESEKMETSNWQEFLLWLGEKHPDKSKETQRALMMINALGRKNRTMKKPLGEIFDPEEIEDLMRSVTTSSSLGFQSRKNVSAAYNALRLYAEYLREKIGSTQSKPESNDNADDGIETIDAGIHAVDFYVVQSYAHTKPVTCKYKGQPIELSGWNAIFHALVQKIYRDYKDIFPVGRSLSSSNRIDVGNAKEMIYPKEIADGVYLECNVSSTAVVNKLRSLMDFCGIAYNDIEIQYRFTGEEKSKKGSFPLKETLKWEPKYTETITRILSAKYKYGFRIGSSIELMKIRNYAEAMNLELPESDEELEKEINAAGSVIDGKVYTFSKELFDELSSIIGEIFSNGPIVVFLSEFIKKHEEWLEENHIASEPLLKEVIKRCKPSLYFGQNIITNGERMTEHEAVVAEIHRIAGSEAVVWITDLAEKLPYIPADKISWSLSASDEFVWISEGKYFCMDHFVYSPEDAKEILGFVSEECANKGYASITDVPMGNIAEENFELSITALYSAVYNAVLKGSYYLNGKILTVDQNGIDITVLLKSYCQNREECTVTELMERAEELTGSPNKQYSLIALYDEMVRVDADRFVSEKHIDFDVDKTDNLLSEIIGNRFAPIRKVSTFALFPTCGLSWNYYLLESYCYRFSKKYRLSVLNYNDKNAGMIASIDLPLTYNEMLSEAAASADIELTPEDVGEFLFANGFTAKRKYSSMPDIIDKAQTIREEK